MKVQIFVLYILISLVLMRSLAFSSEIEPLYTIDFLNPSKPNQLVYIYEYKKDTLYCKDIFGKIIIIKCGKIEKILVERKESEVIKEVLKSSLIKGVLSGVSATGAMCGAIAGLTGVSVLWPIVFIPMFMTATGTATYFDMKEPIDKKNNFCK